MNFFRRSFLLSVSITFLLGYAVLDIGHFVTSNLFYYEEFQHDRMIGVINLAGLGRVLLKHDETPYLDKKLKDALELRDIDFYFIRKDGQLVSYGTVRIPIETLTEKISYNLPGEKSFTGYMPHIAFRYGPYQLAVGLSPSRSNYIKLIFEKKRFSLIFDILIVVLMASAIAFFYFNDIRILIRALKSPGKEKLKDLKPSIQEANLMLRGLQNYESRVDQLRQKQGLLSRHIGSALRTELDSGRTPPYQFRCTMVRTDINQYSTIYSEHPVEDFMSIINDFFSKASKVIARYNGYVTDFVGDEIIYYFKDDDHENSAAIAVAAVREIHEIASQIHRETSERNGYPFTVKSAMACGSLRFGPHINGFALSGGAFVETVRVLSHVDEKSENSIYMPARLASRVHQVCETEIKKTVTLKGIPGVTELHRVSGFRRLDDILTGANKDGEFQALAYFKSPAEVSTILRAASQCSFENVMPILKTLSLVCQPFTDSQVLGAYLALVDQLGSSKVERNIPLSYLVTLSKTLISPELYQTPLQNFLDSCLETTDRRVVANAVEALMHFEPHQRDQTLLKLLKHSDNRVVANTLIKIGMLDLGREVISGLNGLLDSSEPRFKASGAYAVGVLIGYHQSTHPMLLETHDGMRLLIRKVSALISHPDPMVRRQAQISREKFGEFSQAA